MKIVCKIECIAFVVPCMHVLKNAQKTLNLHKTNVVDGGMGQCIKCCCTAWIPQFSFPGLT